MQLSRHDLAQLDEAYLAGLPEGSLRTLSVKLLSDLKELFERLEQNPSNSSRPPSSRAPWEGVSAGEERQETPGQSAEASPAGDSPETAPPAAGEAPEAKAPTDGEPRRPGQRPGAPGHGRTQCLAVHEEEHHHPEVCAACGAPLGAEQPERAVSAHYVIDLAVPEPGRCRLEAIQVKHLYHARQCACGHWSCAAPATGGEEAGWRVALSERHLAGPQLVALICALSLRLRLSRRRVQEFLADWLGLALSAATINQCLHEAGRALTPVLEEQLLAEVRASDLLHADETGWKEHGKLLWLWVFISATTTVFLIGRRSQEFLHSVLGAVLQGWLMSDGYWAYRDYANRLRCLTHLLRKARGLEESLDTQAQRFGRALREHLEGVMAAVYAAREGPPPIALRQQHAQALNALFALCLQHAQARHAKTAALARELLNDWDTFWVVLDHPELPLTNNAAERALRHWVIARRLSYGTRNAQGSRAFTALASVIETCRQRGLSPWTYIAEVLRERRRGNPAPALPAAAAA
jgi:transposase-like protein